MSHWVMFSMPSVHVINANREIDLMINVSDAGFNVQNIKNKHYEIFNNNVKHGVLAIYSINSALESIMVILDKELNIKKQRFYNITNYLINHLNVITDMDCYNKCIELRDFRNEITHWDKNESSILGTLEYLPYMFMNVEIDINQGKEKLISILTKEELKKYIRAFDNLIKNIMSAKIVKENDKLLYMLERIIDGAISYEL